jgi:hypothetical protein
MHPMPVTPLSFFCWPRSYWPHSNPVLSPLLSPLLSQPQRLTLPTATPATSTLRVRHM